MKATGEFTVDLRPLEAYTQGGEGVVLNRLSIDKRFTGDLVATSRGEMLSAVTAVAGSAGYVALEQVIGVLYGRRGSFVLQHSGTMAHGESRLVLEVVPDSGSGELTGLAGAITIRIEGGAHFYSFEYTAA